MSSGFSNLVDESGITRLRVRRGGAPSVAAQYTGNPVVIADGGFDPLTWDVLVGADLLDLSTPTAPTFKEAGTYALTIQVTCATPLTAGGFAWAILNGGAGAEALHPDFAFALAITQIAAVGDVATVQVFNGDGAASRTYNLNGTVVKLA